MTLKELLEMPLGKRTWDKESFLDIVRVPGGWIYSVWDADEDAFAGSVFVPEPEYQTFN